MVFRVSCHATTTIALARRLPFRYVSSQSKLPGLILLLYALDIYEVLSYTSNPPRLKQERRTIIISHQPREQEGLLHSLCYAGREPTKNPLKE